MKVAVPRPATMSSPAPAPAPSHRPEDPPHPGLARSRRLVVEEAAGGILNVLSQVEELGLEEELQARDTAAYRAGEAAAQLVSVAAPEARVALQKVADFVQQSALATLQTLLLCVSALAVGALPGRGLGTTWPPYQSQVSGPALKVTVFRPPISRYANLMELKENKQGKSETADFSYINQL